MSKKEANFNFYDQNYTAKEMAESLRIFKDISKLPKEEFLKKLDEEFLVYESKNDKNSSLITGYYTPILKGSFTRSEKYNAPLYPLPKDLITVDLKQFPVANSVRDIAGKIEDRKLVPYYTREEIEKGALKEKPLLYLDNKVEAFLLEVQGSGIIEIDGKKYYVGYAGKNGHPYTSIGKIVYEEKLIEPSKINMQTIKEFLDSNETMRDYVLNKNKSFVFFKINKEPGIFGNISVALTAKESVAMDSELLPRGALCYIKTEVPKKLNGLAVVPKTEREPFEKFFMIQDTGGAIRGGGRVDIYFGEGEEALFYAGQTASKGEVYLLVAKKENLKNSNGSNR
jgi:membrane-bound lytic murein transglycosylase A